MLRYGAGIALGVVALALALGTDRAQATDDKADEKIKILQALLDRAKAENDVLRKRNEELEDLRVKLILAAEAAKKEALRAENDAKLARAIADDYAKKMEAAIAKLHELKRGDPAPLKPPPPLPAEVRGEVTETKGDVVVINIGIDVGLAQGATLDLYRLDEKTARYLGTVTVTGAMNLFPKQAIVTFTPARKVPIDKLRPEELPKKGDQVRPQVAAKGER